MDAPHPEPGVGLHATVGEEGQRRQADDAEQRRPEKEVEVEQEGADGEQRAGRQGRATSEGRRS